VRHITISLIGYQDASSLKLDCVPPASFYHWKTMSLRCRVKDLVISGDIADMFFSCMSGA
jgi:hypothetical protein